MWFKIHKTEVNLSFTFLGLMLLSLVSPISEVYFYTFLSSILHELIHIIFILIFKSQITYFSLSLFGAHIKRSKDLQLPFIKEAIISFSAPVFNLILGLIVLCLNNKYKVLGLTNIFIGAFNLLPFYTFDGGRGVYYLLKYFLSEKVSQIIITITSVVITVLTAFVTVHIFLNYNKNYTLIIFSFYMIFSLIFKKRKNT